MTTTVRPPILAFAHCLLFAGVTSCAAPPLPPREIVFASASGPIADSTSKLDLFAIRPDGTGLRQITHSPPDRMETNFPDLSPDGRQIVFLVRVRSRSTSELHTIGIDGRNERVIARLDSLGTFYPTYSPDGRRIAFSAGGAPDSTGALPVSIWTVDPDGRNLKQLTRERISYGCPGWLPSGDGLLVTDSRMNGGSRVIRVDYPSGQIQSVVESDSLTFECAFPSPDGTRVLLTAAVFETDANSGDRKVKRMQLYQMTIDGRELRPFVQMAGYGKDPRWSKDGRFVVFLGSSYPGFWSLSNTAQYDSIEIFTTDSRGQQISRLTKNRVTDIHPAW